MAESELKPCPFCGSKNISVLSSDDPIGYFYVYCHSCYVSTNNYKTKAEAKEAWNRRTEDDLYKKGYKDGWNSCVKDKADGWMIDYI